MGEFRPRRRDVLCWGGAAAFALGLPASVRAQAAPTPRDVLVTWYRLVLELVRHTPTYSPPVASRAFAYLGVSAYEASAASGIASLRPLAGQLTDLAAAPAPGDASLDPASVLHGALAFGVSAYFGNTGPTGQRAMAAMTDRVAERLRAAGDAAVFERSAAYGRQVAEHILTWSLADGGAVIENMGFAQTFAPVDDPSRWVPTSTIGLQQAPLLPRWGENRPFAMPAGGTCACPPPVAYSEQPGSAFHAEAMAVYDAVRRADPEEQVIARFWSDDPMLSPTPPGHWISIAMAELEATDADLPQSLDLLARLGITLADAFIGCWHEKYRYDLVRPVTYINRLIDPAWRTLLTTPPFPEYPSGHSTQSGAAASVLAHHFGDAHAFVDTTHELDGIPGRSFANFWAAAEEAAVSRIYGGIHYPMAASAGLDQGRCIGAYATALETRA